MTWSQVSARIGGAPAEPTYYDRIGHDDAGITPAFAARALAELPAAAGHGTISWAEAEEAMAEVKRGLAAYYRVHPAAAVEAQVQELLRPPRRRRRRSP